MKIDYCNGVYYGINESLLKKLQTVQNSAMHIIRKRTNQHHISTSDLFKKYHWLPVKKRVVFKMMLIVHKCLIGKAPQSLCDHVCFVGISKNEEVGRTWFSWCDGCKKFLCCRTKVVELTTNECQN